MRLRTIIAAIIATFCLASPAFADKITNKSVIDLTKAKMSDDIIIAAINGGEPSFDTSANGLIALKNAGVSDNVIQTMIAASSGGGSSTAAAPKGTTIPAGAINPENATLIDNGAQKPMQYLTPQMRTSARGLGFGGVAQYAVLRGTKATLRTSRTPKFLIAVPNNAQPESYFTLASFAVRNNGSREVLVGGGYYSFSTGIHKDRIVAVTTAKAASQSKAPPNFTIYEITPAAELLPGEYALVVYSSQVRTAGYFVSGLDSYFDFGVD